MFVFSSILFKKKMLTKSAWEGTWNVQYYNMTAKTALEMKLEM